MKTNQSQVKGVLRITCLFAFMLIFACSKDENIEPVGGSDDDEIPISEDTIDDVISNLSYDSNELLGVVDTGSGNSKRTPGEEKEEINSEDNVTQTCVTIPYSLKTNFEDIAILKPNASTIWPGALVKVDNELRKGLPTPVTFERAPITIRVDLPGMGENGNVTVEKPDFNTVDAGIDMALEWWNANAYQAGYVNEASSFSGTKTSFSSKQVSMDLGVNIEWASTDFSSQLSFESTAVNRVANMVYKQVFYTVSMPAPSNPAAVFGDDVSAGQIASAFSSSAPPGYIQSVSYGRIIMFRLETSYQATDIELEAALDYAAGKAGSISAESKFTSEQILASSNITTVVIGGNAEVAAEATTATEFGDLAPIIQGENALYTRDNPGSPISYTVRFLKDNTLAKMGYTEDYEAENCSSVGVEHRTIDFINDSNREFRVGITYKNKLPGSGGSISKDELDTDPDRGWKSNKDKGTITEIQPPNGAYDIRIYVQEVEGKDDFIDTYQYFIGDSTSKNNSCHRATTNIFGLDLEVQKVTCL